MLAASYTPLRNGHDGPPLPVPANLEAEQGLLGAILLNNTAYSRVADSLAVEHFYNAAHGRMYSALGTLIERGETADAVTLRHILDADESLAPLGGARYAAILVEAAVTVQGAVDYARAIHEAYLKRELVALAQSIIDDATAPKLDDPAAAQIERAEGRLFALTGNAHPTTANTLAEAAQHALRESETAARGGHGIAGVSSGIKALDRIVGGFRGGDFIIIGGRPGAGKTSLMCSIAWACLKAGVPTHIFSGEMSSPQLAAMLMGMMTDVSPSRQRRGDLDHHDWNALLAATTTLSQWPCIIDDGPLMLPRFLQQARHTQKRLKTGIIFVDHLQLVRLSEDGNQRRYEEVSRISNAMKRAARDLDVPIIGLAQLNRDVEDRENHRPAVSDLRNAGELEQDTDAVILVYRHETYLARNQPVQRERESDIDYQKRYAIWQNALQAARGKAELICDKIRHGETGTAEILFDAARCLFHDPASQGTFI